MLENQPGLPDGSHPGAGLGNRLPDEVQAKVPDAQREEGPSK
jgi:hypothetical protein